jgi:hypothetical protein
MAYALLVVATTKPGVSPSVRVVTVLAVLSSSLFVAGNYRLEYPALIARARWAERQLQLLDAARRTDSRITTGRLFVRVEDVPRFQSFGAAGLAYRLGIDRRQIVGLTPNDPLPDVGPILVVPSQGDVYVLR